MSCGKIYTDVPGAQYWYDRHTRCWWAMAIDSVGNQLGPGDHHSKKDGIRLAAERLVEDAKQMPSTQNLDRMFDALTNEDMAIIGALRVFNSDTHTEDHHRDVAAMQIKSGPTRCKEQEWVGATIRSWDFERRPNVPDRYVEGVVIDYDAVRDLLSVEVELDTVFPSGARTVILTPPPGHFGVLEFAYRITDLDPRWVVTQKCLTKMVWHYIAAHHGLRRRQVSDVFPPHLYVSVASALRTLIEQGKVYEDYSHSYQNLRYCFYRAYLPDNIEYWWLDDDGGVG